MARLNGTQLAALDLMIARMTAEKAESAQISADYTDAIADAIDAWADAVAAAADAYVNFVENIFGAAVMSEEKAQLLQTRLEGRTPPTLEELIALRSHYR